MLDQLPVEIIIQIASYLPTASDIVNLSLTNQELYRQLSTDEHATYRPFVQRNFPTIKSPPFWKEAACILTTRSRAWDRRAFVAKALDTPPTRPAPKDHNRTSHAWPTGSGYAPALDSYETWYGSTWAERQEVLAWGAAGRLMLRIRGADGQSKWHVHTFLRDHLPSFDILDVRLLRPQQRNASQPGEEVIITRANKQITKFKLRNDHGGLREQTRFDTVSSRVERMSVSRDSKPLVAVCDIDSILIFDGSANQSVVRPMATTVLEPKSTRVRSTRSSTFLDESRLVLGAQYLDGTGTAPINVYRVRPDDVSSLPEFSFVAQKKCPSNEDVRRTCASAVVTLDQVSSSISRPAELLLSGWSDGSVHLFDTRAPEKTIMRYDDCVDDGQITSLLPIGHERFLAGGVQNACLKTFDFRMPGARVYSYLHGRPSSVATSSASTHTKRRTSCGHGGTDKKISVYEATSQRLNIFLAVKMESPVSLWQRLPEQRSSKYRRYQGAINSLSSPSPTSPTVYAGIANQVIQLDFVSTDDVRRRQPDPSTFGLGCRDESDGQILDLSCYERPRRGHESTDAVLLRNQVNWKHLPQMEDDGLTEDGWDERWRLASLSRANGRSWRKSD